MPDATPVDRLYNEYSGILALAAGEPSLGVAAGDSLRKALLLAAASYFEYRVCQCVTAYVHEVAGGNGLVVGLVQNKAISRQYHTWFDWDRTNANSFFGLFGPAFKQMMEERVRASDTLRESIRAFLEVGNERNKLIHQDFASFALTKTLDEIYDLYVLSMVFVEGLGDCFRECEAAGVRLPGAVELAVG